MRKLILFMSVSVDWYSAPVQDLRTNPTHDAIDDDVGHMETVVPN